VWVCVCVCVCVDFVMCGCFSLTIVKFFDVLLTVHLSIFMSVINQLDAQNFCFTISLFHSTFLISLITG